MKGKQRCKILKEIRRQIAQNNDIEFVTTECKHQGDCLGTCPKCEAEVRYLERELAKRQRLGKAVTIAGLAVTLSMANAGCVLPPEQDQGDMMPPPADSQSLETEVQYDGVMMPPENMETEGELVEIKGALIEDELDGDITVPGDTDMPGEIAIPESSTEEVLMGEPMPALLSVSELSKMTNSEIEAQLQYFSYSYCVEFWRDNIFQKDEGKCVFTHLDGFTLILTEGENDTIAHIEIKRAANG